MNIPQDGDLQKPHFSQLSFYSFHVVAVGWNCTMIVFEAAVETLYPRLIRNIVKTKLIFNLPYFNHRLETPT